MIVQSASIYSAASNAVGVVRTHRAYLTYNYWPFHKVGLVEGGTCKTRIDRRTLCISPIEYFRLLVYDLIVQQSVSLEMVSLVKVVSRSTMVASGEQSAIIYSTILLPMSLAIVLDLGISSLHFSIILIRIGNLG